MQEKYRKRDIQKIPEKNEIFQVKERMIEKGCKNQEWSKKKTKKERTKKVAEKIQTKMK